MSKWHICIDCAQKQGGKWPRGHVAALQFGKCPKCNEEKKLTNNHDWDWPAEFYAQAVS